MVSVAPALPPPPPQSWTGTQISSTCSSYFFPSFPLLPLPTPFRQLLPLVFPTFVVLRPTSVFVVAVDVVACLLACLKPKRATTDDTYLRAPQRFEVLVRSSVRWVRLFVSIYVKKRVAHKQIHYTQIYTHTSTNTPWHLFIYHAHDMYV